MADARRVPTGEDFHVRDWNFEIDISSEMIAKSVEEALRNTFSEKEYAPRVSLPFEWSHPLREDGSDGAGGPPPKDPLTIDFSLPAFSGNGDTGPIFRTTLEELLADSIELLDDQIGPDEEGRIILAAMSNRLKELASSIDAKLENAN